MAGMIAEDGASTLRAATTGRFAARSATSIRTRKYVHYYLRELPERFHALVDVRAFGPGERIVFEPYTEVYSEPAPGSEREISTGGGPPQRLHLARMRAIEVLPVPRGPAKR